MIILPTAWKEAKFIKQCKGTDETKLSEKFDKSKLWEDYLASDKYDGNYIQVHIDSINSRVMFFTSGGEPFFVKEYAIDFLLAVKDKFNVIVLETEWIGDTLGLLGDRQKSQGIITTWRTDYKKGITSKYLPRGEFKVFDIIDKAYCTFDIRLEMLKNVQNILSLTHITKVTYHKLALLVRPKGSEGIYLKHPSHIQQEGKRVTTAIKRKPRPTYDLLCIDTTEGEGKYEGMIGALVLQDSKGRIVSAGSGLKYLEVSKPPSYFIGKVIEIEAERVTETTYIQPVFKCIREKKDID